MRSLSSLFFEANQDGIFLKWSALLFLIVVVAGGALAVRFVRARRKHLV